MYNILVAECYADIADDIREALADKDRFNVVVTDSGYTASEAVKLKRFDLVFIEHELPYLSGLKTARAIRRSVTFDRTPFIIILPELDERVITEYAGTGVAEFLEPPTKPIRVRAITETVLKNWKDPNDNIRNYIDFQKRRFHGNNKL